MQWTETLMLAALDVVLNNHLSTNKATALHGVPLLIDLVDELLMVESQIITEQEEKELTDYLVSAAKVGYSKIQ